MAPLSRFFLALGLTMVWAKPLDQLPPAPAPAVGLPAPLFTPTPNSPSVPPGKKSVSTSIPASMVSLHARKSAGNPTEETSRAKDWVVKGADATQSILSHLSKGEAVPPSLCHDRFVAIERLVVGKKFEDALSLAFHLVPSDRAALTSTCELETLFDGLGDVKVEITSSFKGKVSKDMSSTMHAYLTLEGSATTYKMFTYGERKWQRGNEGVPVHGFLLGDVAVVYSSPIRCLAPRELSSSGLSGIHCHTGFSVREFENIDMVNAAEIVEFTDLMTAGPTFEFDDTTRDLSRRRAAGGFTGIFSPSMGDATVSGSSMQENPNFSIGEQNILIIPTCLENLAGTRCSGGNEDDIFGPIPTEYQAMATPTKSGFLHQLEESLHNTTEFYKANSNGKLVFNMYIFPGVITIPASEFGSEFVEETCADAQFLYETYESIYQVDATTGEPNGWLYNQIVDGLAGTEMEGLTFNNWGTITRYCDGRAPGSGYVGGNGFTCAWGEIVTGYRWDGTIAHEMGHNLGTHHDSFGLVEYGAPFTVMGHGELPEAHVYGAMKEVMEWMDEDDIVEVGSVHNPLCRLSQWCETKDVMETFEVELQPIDDFASCASGCPGDNNPTLIKIPVPSNPNYYYFIEWRTNFGPRGLTPGVMIYFAPTYGGMWHVPVDEPFLTPDGINWAGAWNSKGGGGVVGPTNLVHIYDASTPTSWSFSDEQAPSRLTDYLLDATLPLGETYALDLSEIGLVITVSELDVDARRTKLNLKFVDQDLPLEFKDDLKCGDNYQFRNSYQKEDVPAVYKVELYDFSSSSSLANETITFTFDPASMTCAPDQETQTYYVYPEYPLHILSGGDLAIGAVAQMDVECPSTGGTHQEDQFCPDSSGQSTFCIDFDVDSYYNGCDYKGPDADDAYISPSAGFRLKEYGSHSTCADGEVIWGFGSSDSDSFYSVISACCSQDYSMAKVKNGDVTIVEVLNQCVLPALTYFNYDSKSAQCLGVGPTRDDCASKGTCLEWGYSDVDGCDYTFDASLGQHPAALAGTGAICSETNQKCFIYQGSCSMGKHCWAMANYYSSGWYPSYQVSCDVHWNDRSSFADVYNECFVPGLAGTVPRNPIPPAECAGAANSFSLTVGDQFSYAGFVWDSMSREYWISTALSSSSVDVQVSCANSEALNFCGGTSYWNGAMCEACPIGAPMMKYGAERFSLDDCVSCEEFLGVPAVYDDEHGECIPRSALCADHEKLDPSSMTCVPLCGETTRLVKFQVENKRACNQLMWNRTWEDLYTGESMRSDIVGVRVDEGNDEHPYPHLTFDKYFTYKFHEADTEIDWYLTCKELLRTVLCDYRPEGDAMNAVSSDEGGWLSTLFGVLSVECCNGGYCDPTGYAKAGDEITGARDIGMCWYREYNATDNIMEPVEMAWGSASHSWIYGLTWGPEDLACPDDKLQGGKMDVYDGYGTLLLTVKEADIDWNDSGVDSAIGHGHMCVPSSAAPGPLRIAIRPHTQGYTTPEDYSVSVASGPWVDTGDTGAVPFLHNEVGLMYQLTDRRDDGLGTSFYFDSPVTPTQAPSLSPTKSSGSGTDPVFNDCNEDSDCSSDELCVINVPATSTTPSSARRLESYNRYAGSPTIPSADGVSSFADLRSPGWKDYGTVSVNGAPTPPLIVHPSGMVAEAESGELVPLLKFRGGRVHADKRQVVREAAKKLRGEKDRRKLFGDMVRGKCTPIS